jgi:ABC-2 type transport system permease protein
VSAFKDTMIITQRQLRLLTRVPEVLIFSTVQPVMFVLLFRYVFGGSISTDQPGGYVQLLMPGIFVQTVAFTLAGTAAGLAEDMKKGLIDRFRSLPISQLALIMGRTLGDSLLNIVVLAVMAIAGYLVGWRPTSGLLSVVIGFVFLLSIWLRTFLGRNLCWIIRFRCPRCPKRKFHNHIPAYLLIQRLRANYRNAACASILC